MALVYKLNVTLWERKPDGDLVSTFKRKLSLPVHGDADIWSLKTQVEAMYFRATNIHLNILELLDGDDCNIEWDAGNLVSQYFVPTAQAAGNDKLYTLKVVGTVDPEEEERRKREGTITGGSFDMSKAVAPPARLEIDEGNQVRRIRGIRDPDQALPSHESDAAEGPVVPQTPVSRKRRHGSDHQFRPAPSSRNTSLQILHSQPNIQFAPTGQGHGRSSQSPKSESPSEPSRRDHPELPVVLETEPSTQNVTQTGDVTINGVDEAQTDQRAISERDSRNVFSSPGYSRKASKEALRRPSRSRSPRRSKWDPPSQDDPSSQPKRPSTLSRSTPRTRNQASQASSYVNRQRESNGSNSPAIEPHEALMQDNSGASDPGSAGAATQDQSTVPTSNQSEASTTDDQADENHGDMVNGHAPSEDVEDAMNIDVPDMDDYADLINLPSKSTRAKPTLEVPSSATPRQRANVPPSAPSPKPSILRKPSIASEVGTSTNSRSSPGGSRRSVSFRADTPSVIGEPVGNPTTVASDADADTMDEDEATSSSNSGEDPPTKTKTGKKRPAVTKERGVQSTHDRNATSADRSHDEMELDTPKAAQAKTATNAATETTTDAAPTPKPKPQKRPATASSEPEQDSLKPKKTPEKSKPTPNGNSKIDPWEAWRLNMLNGVNVPDLAGMARTPAPTLVTSTPKTASKSKSAAKTKETAAKSKKKSTPAPTASAPQEQAVLTADKDDSESDFEASQAVKKSTRKKSNVDKPSKASTIKSTTPAKSAAKVTAAGATKTPSDLAKKPEKDKSSKSTQQMLGDIDERQRSQSVDPLSSKKPTEPIAPSTQTRPTRSRGKNADLAMVQEMRKKSQAASSPADGGSESQQADTGSQPLAKKGKKPPGQRNKNASVLGRPSSKDSGNQKASESPDSTAPPKTKAATKALAVDANVAASANEEAGKDAITGSDAKKIQALSQRPPKNDHMSIAISSGEDSSDSSDNESEIPGRAPDATSIKPADVDQQAPKEQIEDTSSDDVSDSETDEEDSMAVLTKALTAKGDANKSSQSISLTPPISDPAIRRSEPDAPQSQRKPSTRSHNTGSHASHQAGANVRGRQMRKADTLQDKSAAPGPQSLSDSEEEDLPLPKPVVPTATKPTQIATYQLESGSSSDDKEYPVPPLRRFNSSQPTIPPMSSQGRVTSQLNAENLASMPSSQGPSKSSQFGSVETPTPAPGKGSKLKPSTSTRGLSAAASRMQYTKGTGLSSLIKHRAQSRGRQENAPSTPRNTTTSGPAKDHDKKEAAQSDDDDDDDDEESSNSDSDTEKPPSSAKKTARDYSDWSKMIQSAKVGR